MQVRQSWVAALSSTALLAACTQAPSIDPSSTALANGSKPVTIHCGAGQQAFVKQVALAGEVVSQVECVDVRRAAPVRETALLDDAIPVAAPPLRPAVVRERIVYREPAPPAERPAATKKRSGKTSAVIIAGSTAAGAGAGAIVGGKKGALIGAVIGGLGGTVYDRTTRNKR